ncbi:hypothetical protein HTY52_17215, partial [Cupriavidus taiwanensis]|nr:hypothetical protein [Cupriavidus taiwanensis]
MASNDRVRRAAVLRQRRKGWVGQAWPADALRVEHFVSRLGALDASKEQ